MHPNEFDTPPHLVSRLIKKQFPDWSNLSIERFSSAGTDHTLYRLGHDKVVRLPQTSSASEQVDKEQLWLPRLAPFLPLPIPSPLGVGRPSKDYPFQWSIYPWLPGEDASSMTLESEPQMAITLAEFLCSLQEIDPKNGPHPGTHNFFRGVPLLMRDRETRTEISTLHDTFDTERMLKIWEDCLKAPLWNQSPCWIHGDLIPTNILIHKNQVSSIICLVPESSGLD